MGLLHGSKHTRHTYRFDYYRRRIRCWTRFSLYELNGCPDVRFGSQADICGAPTHVRFTPNSDIDRVCPLRGGPRRPNLCNEQSRV
jgi:hypothetical protein